MGLQPCNEKDTVQHLVFVNVSLKMVGGYFNGTVYATKIPEPILNVASIIYLEAVNILVAFKVLAII